MHLLMYLQQKRLNWNFHPYSMVILQNCKTWIFAVEQYCELVDITADHDKVKTGSY